MLLLAISNVPTLISGNKVICQRHEDKSDTIWAATKSGQHPTTKFCRSSWKTFATHINSFSSECSSLVSDPGSKLGYKKACWKERFTSSDNLLALRSVFVHRYTCAAYGSCQTIPFAEAVYCRRRRQSCRVNASKEDVRSTLCIFSNSGPSSTLRQQAWKQQD